MEEEQQLVIMEALCNAENEFSTYAGSTVCGTDSGIKKHQSKMYFYNCLEENIVTTADFLDI